MTDENELIEARRRVALAAFDASVEVAAMFRLALDQDKDTPCKHPAVKVIDAARELIGRCIAAELAND